MVDQEGSQEFMILKNRSHRKFATCSIRNFANWKDAI